MKVILLFSVFFVFGCASTGGPRFSNRLNEKHNWSKMQTSDGGVFYKTNYFDKKNINLLYDEKGRLIFSTDSLFFAPLGKNTAVKCDLNKNCELIEVSSKKVLKTYDGQEIFVNAPYVRTSDDEGFRRMQVLAVILKTEKIIPVTFTSTTKVYKIALIKPDGELGPSEEGAQSFNSNMQTNSIEISFYTNEKGRFQKTYSPTFIAGENVKVHAGRSFKQIASSNLYQEVNSATLAPENLPAGIEGFKLGVKHRIFAAVKTDKGLRYTGDVSKQMSGPFIPDLDWSDVEEILVLDNGSQYSRWLFAAKSESLGGWHCQEVISEGLYSLPPYDCRSLPVQSSMDGFRYNYTNLVTADSLKILAENQKTEAEACSKMPKSSQTVCYQKVGGSYFVTHALTADDLTMEQLEYALSLSTAQSKERQTLAQKYVTRAQKMEELRISELRNCVRTANTWASIKERNCARQIGGEDWFAWIEKDRNASSQDVMQAIAEAKKVGRSTAKMEENLAYVKKAEADKAYFDQKYKEEQLERNKWNHLATGIRLYGKAIKEWCAESPQNCQYTVEDRVSYKPEYLKIEKTEKFNQFIKEFLIKNK